jgi:GABA permease
MMPVAGVLDARLFVESGHAMAAVGPAVLIAYPIADGFVVLVMRLPREITTAHPDSGSFSTYADRAVGH